MPDTVTRTMPTPEIVSFMGMPFCLLLNIDFDFLCKFRFTAYVSDATGKRPRGPRKICSHLS